MKCVSVLKKIENSQTNIRIKNGKYLIIAADTMVICDNEVIGKPQNKEDAFRILKLLSGRSHYLITGVCIYDSESTEFEEIFDSTEVFFSKLSDDDIKSYLNESDEYRTRAGAYSLREKASLFISKLQSHPRQSNLAKAIQEYGKLIKSIYIPKYICREDQQRRVSLQLNKGEALHSLRGWLLFANEGKLRKSQLQDQATQASSLTLVTNAVIAWNTRYMQAVIAQLKEEGHTIRDSDLKHTSPCRFDHINKHGKYNFNVDEEMNRKELRPLRKP